MSVKPFVLDGYYGIDQMGRNRIDSQLTSKLLTPPGEYFPVAVKEGDGSLGSAIYKAISRRQGRIEVYGGYCQNDEQYRRHSPTKGPDNPEYQFAGPTPIP